MSDSSLFPTGANYQNLAGRMQAKVFVVDDTVNPAQAGWVTVEALIAGVVAGMSPNPSNVLDFSDGTTALFGDGTPITFSS